MIQRLLVANRGEIARRVFRTCRRLGIETVAVFSDIDRDEPHTLEADHAFQLPGATARDTYLNAELILDVAARAGADAVHPGYGFLSENAMFAGGVTGAGMIWVGPTPASMAQMGSKLEAKALMAEAGVPVLGHIEVDDSVPADLAERAIELGFPLLVKASAGGGGKGMRVVEAPSALGKAVEAASREAANAFGDGTVFIEKYLTSPRHIEIQIIGDQTGDVVSLFERECSIQRRHQKVIEESPAWGLDPVVRQAMSEAAVAAGKAVGYVGAGTVEFIYEGGRFYFLEMNTRLQVEHPVTEMVTGLDLVAVQIAIANGFPIPDEVRNAHSTGHAVEARLYSEDALNDFLPVTGPIELFEFPVAAGLRVDSGVEAGSVISIHYDPMLAKVIAHGESRLEATRLLSESLRGARIHAETTNRDLLVRILEDHDYLDGNLDTHFLDRRGMDLMGEPLASNADEVIAARACAMVDQLEDRRSARVLGTIPSGWRNQRAAPQQRAYAGRKLEHQVSYRLLDDTVTFDGRHLARIINLEPGFVSFEQDGIVHELAVARYGDRRYVDDAAWAVRLIALPRFTANQVAEESGSLHAPMPGKVTKVHVAEGDHVEEGDVLVVLEAMKMEHALTAPYPGTIEAVRFGAGDQVEARTVLVVVVPD